MNNLTQSRLFTFVCAVCNLRMFNGKRSVCDSCYRSCIKINCRKFERTINYDASLDGLCIFCVNNNEENANNVTEHCKTMDDHEVLQGTNYVEDYWERLNPDVENQSVDSISHPGYIEQVKTADTLRILYMNPHGFRLSQTLKTRKMIRACKEQGVDMMLLSKTNTNWNTRNTRTMEQRLRKVHANIHIVTYSTNAQVNPGSDYLPGGTLSVTWGAPRNFVIPGSEHEDDMGCFCAFKMQGKRKIIQVINLYRMPENSSKGPCTVKHQCDVITGRKRNEKYYRAKTFEHIVQYVHKQQNVADIIIAGDINSGINEEDVEQFCIALGIFDVFSFYNNINEDEREKTYIRGRKCIDLVAMSAGLLGYLRGCKMVNFTEIICTDHRGFIVDLDLNSYFEVETSNFDLRKLNKLDHRRKSHREKFIDKAESILETVKLEEVIDVQ